MKKSILITAVCLLGASAYSAEKLNCMVQKFDGQTYNLSKDEEITFKGLVDTEKVMLIDNIGGVKIVDNADGVDLSKTQLGVVLTLGDLVIVSNPVKKVEAMGNKSAILVDHQSGIAVICAKE